MNRSRAGLVIVVPVTRTRRGLPSHVEIEPASSGLRETGYAKCARTSRRCPPSGWYTASATPRHELRRIVEVIILLLDA